MGNPVVILGIFNADAAYRATAAAELLRRALRDATTGAQT